MKIKWVLIILLVGLFFNVSKANEVYCKDKDNEALWGNYHIYEFLIYYYEGNTEWISECDYERERICYEEARGMDSKIWNALKDKISSNIENEKKDLLESGECRFWDE